MNGVAPMMSPVSGSRRGAPAGAVSRTTTTIEIRNPIPANFRPRDSFDAASGESVLLDVVGRPASTGPAAAR